MPVSKFAIGAATSGSGKTTLALGLMRILSREGLDVAPFKCGPDYIDTQFHRMASGRSSVNLDLFMSSPEHISELFGCYGGDVCIVEGAMGLFDGYERDKGSAADVASTLGIPVVLLADGSSTAYSTAPLLYGFSRFRPELKIAGVVFNRTASERHETMLREAAEDAGIECLGCIRRDKEMVMPSRHLGLSLGERERTMECIERAARAVEAGVDVRRVLEVTAMPNAQGGSEWLSEERPIKTSGKVAVARDEAFSFVYEANLRRLRLDGYEVVEFSPLAGDSLPEGIDLLYLPGGYPELFKEELAGCRDTLQAIREFGEQGGRILAECGGLLALSREIDGSAMAGLLPFEVTMQGARLHLGYRTVQFDNGQSVRGHEFHYSTLRNPDALPSVARQLNARNGAVDTPVYRYKNTIAGYTHLYWAENDIFKLWE